MTTELRLPSSLDTELASRRHRFTVASYHAITEAGALPPEGRTELLNGEIFTMAPICPLHRWSNRRLLEMVIDACRADGCWYLIDQPILLSDTSEPQPDIAVIRPRDDEYINEHPTPKDVVLLIAIADSTLATDRTIKAQLYAANGIQEYLLIDLNNRRALVYTNPSVSGYETVREYLPGDTVISPSIPSLHIQVSNIVPPAATQE